MNFGFVTREGVEYKTVKQIWLEGERLGFDSAWLCDHFMADGYHLECWSTLSALSSHTKDLRFGPMVLCNSYRPPPVVAAMSATLDVVSEGRLELGMGAGWLEREYSAYGFPFPRTRIRIEQMTEAIRIIKRLWTEDSTSYEGKYFSVEKAAICPKPVQKPHPRIWVGGYGEKYLLKSVAEVADGYILRKGATPEEYKHKMEVLEKHCETAGRDAGEIRKAWVGCVHIGKDEQQVKEKIRSFKTTFSSSEKTCGHVLDESIVGTPAQCIEKIHKYIEAGVTDVIWAGMTGKDLPSLQLFSDHVMSTIRGK